MRIVIDLQGAQSESRFRGIGRYSFSLAHAIARNAGTHEIWLVLNAALPAIVEMRDAFRELVPQERIRVFDTPVPVAESDSSNAFRTRASEKIREYFIAQLQPDMVLVTSLFEGYVDDAVVSVGAFGEGTNTAVILYDLIPYLNPSSYLATSEHREYYYRKIDSLKNAGLLLSISDYSRQEAIDSLGVGENTIVSISTATDARFKPQHLSVSQSVDLCQRFGITKKIVMCAPGGFDPRKNIHGLISAYALLPPDLRAEYQLMIVSKLGDAERGQLNQHRKEVGLDESELVLTGYVDEETLVALYNLATLFVFPSMHEGFGLPALEAMSCGTAVIGSGSTSIPEVIGCDEALFDASSPRSIAEKIAQVLNDEEFLRRLRSHGLSQSKKFSWDASAMCALRALEHHKSAISGNAVAGVGTLKSRKPTLAFVSPLPPEKTGIANYSAELLPALLAYFEIDLITDQANITLPPSLAALPRRSIRWFEKNAGRYERILYQFGNSPFHSPMFDLLSNHPGVVVLHDFFLSSVLAYEELFGNMPGAWRTALYRSHGYQAVQASFKENAIAYTKDTFPCNLDVIQDARSVIVHSQYSTILARRWYGEHAADNWRVIPLLRSPAQPFSRNEAREILGINKDAFVICSFGFIDATKLNHRLLKAWLSALKTKSNCQLIFVGEKHDDQYGADFLQSIKESGHQDHVRITGWVDDSTYKHYLQAADVAVQLRCMTRGETSAAILDCLNYGLATIVNAHGSMADLCDEAAWKLPDEFSDHELCNALQVLYEDGGKRMALSSAAAQLIRTQHSPAQCARSYAETIEFSYEKKPETLQTLFTSLTEIPDFSANEKIIPTLAQTIAACEIRRPQHRQLLVDISAVVRSDLKTGIERVVRSQLSALLQNPPDGFRVEPVYLSNENGIWHYRYACEYTKKFLSIGATAWTDAPVDIHASDIFYGADYFPDGVAEAAKHGIYTDMRARGVTVNFLVYDLLPILKPDFFPVGADQRHSRWLDCIAANADKLICISGAVADEVRIYLQRHNCPGAHHPEITAVHLGADVEASAPSLGLPDNAGKLLEKITATTSFLSLGTIEPRKGHLQTLAAFEQLWQEGKQVNLVIVGNEGWTSLPDNQRRTIPLIVNRLRNHPELGKRLFWLEGISDEFLEKIQTACTCLVIASEGEGFGLPLIEAARNKLPIIARNIPVFREVANENACYFNGLSADALADSLRQWLIMHANGTVPSSAAMQWKTWAQNVFELTAVLTGDKDRIAHI